MARPVRNILLPALLLVPLVWVMVGCVYVPTFGLGQGPRTDFRRVGGATSSKPVRPGVARAAVVKMFGEPELISADGLTIGYGNYATTAYWIGVIPPFFFNYPAHQAARGLKLVFRTDETLDHFGFCEVVATNSFFAPLWPGDGHHAGPSNLCGEFNAYAPANELLLERWQVEAAKRVVPGAATTAASTKQSTTQP